jgi:glycosyltransferase involved in cell wall biosynthesis
MVSPLVSIIIPAYNASKYLKEAVDSALAQTYANIEVLVINDGSDDDGATERSASTYGDRIRYFLKPNGGVSSALNYGISQMRGEWLSWLSHDDLYVPEKIERQISLLETFINAADPLLQNGKVIVFSNAGLIDAAGNQLPAQQRSINKETDTAIETILKNLRRNNLMGCTFLVPRKCFNELGGFDESLRALQDFDFWYRLLFAGYEFKYIPEKLVAFRVHREQVTYRIPERIKQEQKEFYIRTVNQLGNHTRLGTFQALFTLGCYLLERGNEPEAARLAFTFAGKKGLLPVYGILSALLRPPLAFYGKIRFILKRIYFRVIIQKKRK